MDDRPTSRRVPQLTKADVPADFADERLALANASLEALAEISAMATELSLMQKASFERYSNPTPKEAAAHITIIANLLAIHKTVINIFTSLFSSPKKPRPPLAPSPTQTPPNSSEDPPLDPDPVRDLDPNPDLDSKTHTHPSPNTPASPNSHTSHTSHASHYSSPSHPPFPNPSHTPPHPSNPTPLPPPPSTTWIPPPPSLK
jgi:hypothetical protein